MWIKAFLELIGKWFASRKPGHENDLVAKRWENLQARTEASLLAAQKRIDRLDRVVENAQTHLEECQEVRRRQAEVIIKLTSRMRLLEAQIEATGKPEH